MSLILDALRKSEHQRQRETGPALAVIPESGHVERLPTWVLVLGALLVLNALVLAGLLLTKRPDKPVAVDAPAAAPVSSPQAGSAASPAALARPETADRSTPLELPSKPPRSEVRPLTTEVGDPPQPASSAGNPSTARQGGTRAPAQDQAVFSGTANEDARLPRFNDLVVRGELNVPHMHVDIHVFSGDPGERFVFINMRRYNEGQATQEGPRVERITRDGVVMDYQGQRFFLARD